MQADTLVIDSAACYLSGSLSFWERERVRYGNISRVLRRATSILQKHKEGSVQDEMKSLEQVQYLLSKGFGVKRSTIQVEIHKEFTEACLPKIFQNSWKRNKAVIMKQFNVKEIHQEVLVVMPRRRGKSYSTAMFAAACLLSVPSCSCIIFSTGERTAQLLMTVIVDMIEKAFTAGALKRDDYHFETNNKEAIIFIGPDGTKRSLMCLPGSVRVRNIFFIFRWSSPGQLKLYFEFLFP
jgi:hypothetical protein